MIVTGIAPSAAQLGEKSALPSTELVHLASSALSAYQADHLYTCLSAGWEQALARAALELQLPFTVMVPFPQNNIAWPRSARALYHQLRSKASELRQVSGCCPQTASIDYHCWMAAQSDLLIVLWDFAFQGDVFEIVDYALKKGKQVVNLWQEWDALLHLRRARPSAYQSLRRRAQVFESRKTTQAN